MNAIKVFESLVQTAYGILSFWGDRMRRGKYESKPGELIEKLSPPEREALQKLTVDDLKTIEPTPGMISLLAECAIEADPQKWVDDHLRKEKLEFDKTLNLPIERKKRYGQ